MATETLVPDGVASAANISSTLGDYTAQDGTWAAADGNGEPDVRLTFPSPSGDPNTGAGLQTFNVFVRKDAGGGNNVDFNIELWEGGSGPLATQAVSGLSSTTGAAHSLTWDASLLSTADGSGVEVRLFQTSGGTGNPGNRRYLEVDIADWDVDYSVGSRTGTLDATEAADTATLAGEVDVSGTLGATESTDTASLAGAVAVDGSLSATEAGDTASFAGSVGDPSVTGTLDATEAADGASLSGGISVAGSFGVTDAQDAASFAGGVSWPDLSGVLSASETNDQSSFAGAVDISGALSASEALDAASFAEAAQAILRRRHVQGGMTVT